MMATCQPHEVLHDDVWVEILSWLPLRDLVKCRSVSKAWCRSLVPLAYSRRWRFGLLQLASDRILPEIRYEYNGMSRLDEDDFHLGEFRDYLILDACNGYILFQFSEFLRSALGFDCYTVLNPITQKFSRHRLSKTSPTGIPAFSMLAFDPQASPYYKVILVFDYSAPDTYEAHIFSSEAREWTCSAVDPEIGHSMTYFGPTICFNGLAYQLGVVRISDTGGGVRTFKENIILFHVEGEQWELIQPPVVTLAPDKRLGLRGLGQSAGTLHYVYHERLTFRIWALQDFCASNDWILKHTVNLCPDNSPRNLSFHPNVVFHPFVEAVFLSSRCGSSYIYRLNDKEFDLFCHLKGAKKDEPYVIPILYCLNDPNSNRTPFEN